jgi:hypothetical protein
MPGLASWWVGWAALSRRPQLGVELDQIQELERAVDLTAKRD